MNQGVVGLALWLSFMVWVLGRPAPAPRHSWSLGWRLLWVCCLTNFLMAVLVPLGSLGPSGNQATGSAPMRIEACHPEPPTNATSAGA